MLGFPTEAMRAASLIGALAAAALLAPLLATIALAVRADGGAPVLYSERRLGRRGRAFRIYKFRTLRVGSRGPRVAPPGDPRITRIGSWLRRWHLDELPQLINIVRGEMAFVGPRPEPEAFWRHVEPELRARVLRFKPGVTSPAALAFLCEDDVLAEHEDAERLYRSAILPAKAARDAEYFERATPLHRLGTLLRTVRAVFGHDDARCAARVRRLLQDAGSGRTEASQ
jgi:lipopolysaccharide/colanic/teichoic acid biosynthesis glycosyltransferase